MKQLRSPSQSVMWGSALPPIDRVLMVALMLFCSHSRLSAGPFVPGTDSYPATSLIRAVEFWAAATAGASLFLGWCMILVLGRSGVRRAECCFGAATISMGGLFLTEAAHALLPVPVLVYASALFSWFGLPASKAVGFIPVAYPLLVVAYLVVLLAVDTPAVALASGTVATLAAVLATSVQIESFLFPNSFLLPFGPLPSWFVFMLASGICFGALLRAEVLRPRSKST